MPHARPTITCSLLMLLAGAAPEARAAGPEFEITPFGGYRIGGQFETPETQTAASQDVDLEDGGSWGVDIGLYRDRTSFYEFLYSTSSTELDTTDPTLAALDVKTEYYHVGGTLLFADERWWAPWFSFTVGATRFSAGGGYDSDTKFSVAAGGGVRVPFNDYVAATAGVRGYLTFVESDTDFLCVSTGTQGGCLLNSTGSTWFQFEGLIGITVGFR
jgi:hypothetical protein